MNLLVRNIVERNLLEGAKLVAGEGGADNPVQWVNFMEILDALDSLQKGELLVTTGFQLDDRARFKDFIVRLKSRGVCAVAIQTGYYISEIPRYILSEANRYGLPVIELPAALTFSHIMHVLIDNIGLKKEEKNDSDLTALRGRALKLSRACPSGPEEKKYFAMLTAAGAGSFSPRSGLMREADKIRACLAARSSWVGMEPSGSRVLYLASLRGPFTGGDVVVDLMNVIQQISREGRVNVWVGLSLMKNPDGTEPAFEQALTANQTLRNMGTKKGACCYDNLRLFEWFEHFHKKSNSLSFAYDTLKPVISYDYFHRCEYLHTLRVYLANDCRISETAEKLFIHRHTLSNRLSRIASLCCADFEDYFTRMHYSVAVFLYDYYLS